MKLQFVTEVPVMETFRRFAKRNSSPVHFVLKWPVMK